MINDAASVYIYFLIGTWHSDWKNKIDVTNDTVHECVYQSISRYSSKPKFMFLFSILLMFC